MSSVVIFFLAVVVLVGDDVIHHLHEMPKPAVAEEPIASSKRAAPCEEKKETQKVKR